MKFYTVLSHHCSEYIIAAPLGQRVTFFSVCPEGKNREKEESTGENRSREEDEGCNGSLLCVLGSAGMGKSAVLARAAKVLQQARHMSF